MQNTVITDRNIIRHIPAKIIRVTALKKDSVFTVTTEHDIDKGRHVGLVGVIHKRQQIRNKLKGVIAVLAKEQIRSLTIKTTGKDIVARTAKDPVFTHAAHEYVMAGTAHNHIFSYLILTLSHITDIGVSRWIKDKVEAVNGGHQVG